ncbi:MAG: hydantoinase/oxoprolinase, partial [Candidatus Eremiobacteraeota bacterium]|nr:hydantoinase/oxoprolinase [Candidatus Eremiobacteraeota bacterium]
IAGGSMVRLSGKDVVDVGPRSAHIAGLGYAAFTPLALISSAQVERIKPTPHDPDDYVALIATDGSRIAITPTCAANALGYVPESAFAFGNAEAATAAFQIIGREIGVDAQALARRVLDVATDKVIAAVNELIADYELDPENLVIVGGGGGAAALVPYAAQRCKHHFRLARDAEVISPIGVALALVRDVVERTIVDPTPADIISLRREAGDKVIAGGAAPESVDVAIEIDTQRNLVRATASGASALSEDALQAVRSPEEQVAIAAALLRCDASALQRIQATPVLTIFKCERNLRALDQTGVARLAVRDALITQTDAAAAPTVLAATLEEQTSFGDVGRALPNIFLIHGARIADLSGLATAAQVVALATEELGGLDASAPVAIVTARNKA